MIFTVNSIQTEIVSQPRPAKLYVDESCNSRGGIGVGGLI